MDYFSDVTEATKKRLELAREGTWASGSVAVVEAVKAVSPGSDITFRYYLGLETKGCFLYVAPEVLRAVVGLYGADEASITFEPLIV